MKREIKNACMEFGNDTYTAYQVYDKLMNRPKKLGGMRRNTPSYAEIKQTLPRCDYAEKVPDEYSEKTKTATYRNKVFE